MFYIVRYNYTPKDSNEGSKKENRNFIQFVQAAPLTSP